MQQHEIDRIIARLLVYKPDATDAALCRATGYTEHQVALARYRAVKPVRRAQAPQQALGPAHCHVDGCTGAMEYTGMCRKHYQRAYRTRNATSDY